jgi:hypothetical protein
VQNKLHWAIHGQTAAEVILNRANAEKTHMGLTNWQDAPAGKIQKFDVSIAKNYLTDAELAQLQRLVNAYLDIAEDMALRNMPMTMADWAKKLDAFLQLKKGPALLGAKLAQRPLNADTAKLALRHLDGAEQIADALHDGREEHRDDAEFLLAVGVFDRGRAGLPQRCGEAIGHPLEQLLVVAAQTLERHRMFRVVVHAGDPGFEAALQGIHQDMKPKVS